jgi:oligopeptide/dipeptide ABC transporter ATP-binding protein
MAEQHGVLEVINLKKYYPVRTGFRGTKWLQAVDDVSLRVGAGETVGLVGESGSGKTTVAKCVLRLEEPTGGQVLLEGKEVTGLRGETLRRLRRDMQMVFQDPIDSLNPRLTVADMVAEPLWIHGLYSRKQARGRTVELLEAVGLGEAFAKRYPHQLSGGERQRVGIARAIATRPKLVILDEPTSSLDVSVQAKLLNLLTDLQEELDLSYLFITHDLSVVSGLATRVAVMYLGQIVELGPTQEVFSRPIHPYTRALVSAVPISHPREVKDRIVLPGEGSSGIDPPRGCRLAMRCPLATEICGERSPLLREVSAGHFAACHMSLS